MFQVALFSSTSAVDDADAVRAVNIVFPLLAVSLAPAVVNSQMRRASRDRDRDRERERERERERQRQRQRQRRKRRQSKKEGERARARQRKSDREKEKKRRERERERAPGASQTSRENNVWEATLRDYVRILRLRV